MFKIPTKTANCDQETSCSFTICHVFALERNYCDKIFDKMIGAAYVRSSRGEYKGAFVWEYSGIRIYSGIYSSYSRKS